MKVAIVGSRDFTDKRLFNKIINHIFKKYIDEDITEIVSGGARGTDTLAENYADENKIAKKIFEAKWNLYGKGAGYIRNRYIWEEADLGIAFWDGESKGTAHSFKLAEEMEKKLIVVRFKIYIKKKKEVFKIRKIYYNE